MDHFNNLTISVPNEFWTTVHCNNYNNYRSYNSQHLTQIRANGSYHQGENISRPIPGTPLLRGKSINSNNNNSSAYMSKDPRSYPNVVTPPTTTTTTAAEVAPVATTMMVNNSSEQQQQQQQQITPHTGHQNIVTRSNNQWLAKSTPDLVEVMNNNLNISNGTTHKHIKLWPLNFTNLVRVLHRQVRVLGIFSGYALVAMVDSLPPSKFIECDPFVSGFPGDAFLWQPPMATTNTGTISSTSNIVTNLSSPKVRSNFIDTASVMPVVMLDLVPGRDGSAGGRMKVRVMGVNVLLDISVADVYQFPEQVATVKDLRADLNYRQVTMVRLASIPSTVDCLEQHVFADVYFSPGCLGEDDFIFERCAKRGDFLNVMLLLHYSTIDVPRLAPTMRQTFVDLLLAQLDSCKSALVPSFYEMAHGPTTTAAAAISQSGTECSVLSAIERSAMYENKMLVGSPSYFSPRSYQTEYVDVKLERIVYHGKTDTFHFFDRNLAKADVNSHKPVVGLFALNENFANSRLAHASKLRFQVAMLLYSPDYWKLKCMLNNY